MEYSDFLRKNIARAQKKWETLHKYVYWENRLDDISPDQKIYRIESIDNFLCNLEQRQLYFKYPGAWKDIFDGAFVRTPIFFKQNGITVDQAYNRNYFCQCWSCEEQDVLWKLYSQDCKGIMIVSTVDKVMNSIWNRRDDFIHTKRYVGGVIYFPASEMQKEDFIEGIFKTFLNLTYSSGRGIAQTFLFKPDHLTHEKEIRFIVKEENKMNMDYSMVNMFGEPKDFIDKVLIDPRASNSSTDEILSRIKNYGLRVEKSLLSAETINSLDVSGISQISKDGFGLPKGYVFTKAQ